MKPEEPRYSDLEALAERVVEEALSELPPEIAVRARTVPVLIRPEAGENDHSDVPPEELMGLFCGLSYGEGPSSDPEDQPRISLFLWTIWDEADGNREEFCEELRLTFLHELGHYLGWDEDDLEERGLG